MVVYMRSGSNMRNTSVSNSSPEKNVDGCVGFFKDGVEGGATDACNAGG